MESEVYKKILKIREDMNKVSFARETKGYKYNYLDYPTLCEKLDTLLYTNQLFIQITFENNECKAFVFDVNKPEDKAVFISPIVAENNVVGATPIQSIGAMHTYMRRYMKLLIFDIVIEDEVEKQANNNYKQEKTNKQTQQSAFAEGVIDIAMIQECINNVSLQDIKQNLTAQQMKDYGDKNKWTFTYKDNAGQSKTYKVSSKNLQKQVGNWLKYGLK